MEEVRLGRSTGDAVPGNAARRRFSLCLRLSSGKNANSATANFAQLHPGELPASKRANEREKFEGKKNAKFHLNALQRNSD